MIIVRGCSVCYDARDKVLKMDRFYRRAYGNLTSISNFLIYLLEELSCIIFNIIKTPLKLHLYVL